MRSGRQRSGGRYDARLTQGGQPWQKRRNIEETRRHWQHPSISGRDVRAMGSRCSDCRACCIDRQGLCAASGVLYARAGGGRPDPFKPLVSHGADPDFPEYHDGRRSLVPSLGLRLSASRTIVDWNVQLVQAYKPFRTAPSGIEADVDDGRLSLLRSFRNGNHAPEYLTTSSKAAP